MIDYNPFDKTIEKIRKTDLQKLIAHEVAEGWYVEFKEDFPSTKKIGHSIAAFANSNGGWFIVGVRANSANIAEEIVGFELSKYRRPTDKIRDIIKNHISPIPHFESKLIKISKERAVLITYISQGINAPYITNDGRIYRRVGEGSDPIPETDRYSIQKLFERSQELSEQVKNFSQDPFGKAQDVCYLEAYFYVAPFHEFEFEDFFEEAFIENLCTKFSSPTSLVLKDIQANTVLNGFKSSFNSYILQQSTDEHGIFNISLIVEIFSNGNARMFLSFPQIMLHNYGMDIPKYYRESEHFNKFWTAYYDQIEGHVAILDGYHFFTVFTIFFNRYVNLLNTHKYKNDLHARFRISGSQNVLLYLDDENFMTFLQEYGLPICLKSEIEIPKFIQKESLLIPATENKIWGVIHLIYEALGFPTAFTKKSMEGLGYYFVKLAEASNNQQE